VFFLHHALIDRTWWQWQMLDPKNRILGNNAIAGTGTFLNIPPSPNTTFDTVIDLNYVGGPDLPMKDLMSTFDGPFCYVYA
jgi:tyrosinase